MGFEIATFTAGYRLIAPFLRWLPPEAAHDLILAALGLGLAPRRRAADEPSLATRAFGLSFPNAIGLAAGFDKNAEAVDAMFRFGFGFVEVGTVTPKPQAGNPKPRLFRLTKDEAVINRLGFNSDGMAQVAERLRRRGNASGHAPGVVGVNVGKNRESENASTDYAAAAATFAGLADYLVLNVSSPNTPGLRDLQTKARVREVLEKTRAAITGKELGQPTPLLLKVAPDLEEAEREGIAEVALEGLADGLVIGNTTLTRPSHLQSPLRHEAGGLSGKPLFALSTEVLADFYRRTEGRVPLIGTGGIASGEEAYAKVRAGASLVQLYTALVFEGPALVTRIRRELDRLLRRDGFTHVEQAIGADHR